MIAPPPPLPPSPEGTPLPPPPTPENTHIHSEDIFNPDGSLTEYGTRFGNSLSGQGHKLSGTDEPILESREPHDQPSPEIMALGQIADRLDVVVNAIGRTGLFGNPLSPEAGNMRLSPAEHLRYLLEVGAPEVPPELEAVFNTEIAPGWPTEVREEIFADFILSLTPPSDEYIPTRRELARLKPKGLASDEMLGGKLTSAAAAQLAHNLDKMFPNGLETNEAEVNEMFKKIVGTTTGNGDDFMLRFVFARRHQVDGKDIYTTFDSDRRKSLTESQLSLMKRRRKYLRNNLADLGAASVYEITKMQEDMQEEGWENMLNVWHDIGLTYDEVQGLYVAIKFAHKGTMLTNKHRTPEALDTDGNVLKNGKGKIASYRMGKIDKVMYVTELAEKVSKHAYQYSVADVQTLVKTAEGAHADMVEYFYTPDARQAPPADRWDAEVDRAETVIDPATGKEKIIDHYTNQGYRKYAECLYFYTALRQVMEKTKLGPSMDEAKDDSARQMQQATIMRQRAAQAQYDPQIPGSAIANYWWMELDKLITRTSELFPSVKNGPSRFKQAGEYEELDAAAMERRGRTFETKNPAMVKRRLKRR